MIDNDIHNVAAEYNGGVVIFVGFAADTTIAHNEIADQPYTGISFGGVGLRNRSYAARNTINGNYVHDVMQVLDDGGCIYTLGTSPTSTMSLNYVTGDNADYGALYLDTTIAHWFIAYNVVGPVATDWLPLQTDLNYPDAARDNTVEHN